MSHRVQFSDCPLCGPGKCVGHEATAEFKEQMVALRHQEFVTEGADVYDWHGSLEELEQKLRDILGDTFLGLRQKYPGHNDTIYVECRRQINDIQLVKDACKQLGLHFD